MLCCTKAFALRLPYNNRDRGKPLHKEHDYFERSVYWSFTHFKFRPRSEKYSSSKSRRCTWGGHLGHFLIKQNYKHVLSFWSSQRWCCLFILKNTIEQFTTQSLRDPRVLQNSKSKRFTGKLCVVVRENRPKYKYSLLFHCLNFAFDRGNWYAVYQIWRGDLKYHLPTTI